MRSRLYYCVALPTVHAYDNYTVVLTVVCKCVAPFLQTLMSIHTIEQKACSISYAFLLLVITNALSYFSFMYHLLKGFRDLMHDNITEHPSTINVLARMNIYQEVTLAAIYRSLSFLQVLILDFHCVSNCP
jgi:hypothetical protein